MHRRKPFSAKQRKEQLQLKRAVKRGDVPPPQPSAHKKGRKGPTAKALDATTRTATAESTRRLESSFVKLPAEFLEITKVIASTLPLTRPIPPEFAILPDVDKHIPGADGPRVADNLTCPRRPKWRYDMSKKEVEANEEGLFKKWLSYTDATVNAWCSLGEPHSLSAPAPDSMPHAPTSFERNLEVWRQLWRVTEISQILLILLDSRCPILHFPPALSFYLTSLPHASRTRTILVLTKVDIAGADRAAAWSEYLTALYPGMRVVQVESYMEKHPAEDGGGRKKVYEPRLPSAFRQTLVNALQETHTELLEPPPAIKSNPERLAQWKPKVRPSVDWGAVLRAHGGQVGTVVGGAAVPNYTSQENQDRPDGLQEEEDSTSEFLTVGLIGKFSNRPETREFIPRLIFMCKAGQPNVGKSSLLNALFGTQKVRASRTPGKTKHFQTLFWTSEVRLVDCPGLVIPNYVPMETQVLSGILPISRVSAVPLCIYHAARLIPLEQILGLTHPTLASPVPEDKRTWREGMHPSAPAGVDRHPDKITWTAMDILTAYAEKKGWVTAKAGRPDVNRAGNAILRALSEGRIRWAFWPPGTDAHTITNHKGGASAGIWIAHDHDSDVEITSDHDSEEDMQARPGGSEDTLSLDSNGEGDEEASGMIGRQITGRFGALALDYDETDDDAEE